jgi:hypothetical protein
MTTPQSVVETPITNEERSRREVATFIAEPPFRYFAYQSHDATIGRLRRFDLITTWKGDKLAEVVSVGQLWTSNMGDKRQAFQARGVNGVLYSGTAYLSCGDYVRMRAVKS